MNHSERMLQTLRITGKSVWKDGRIVTFTSNAVLTGVALAQCLEQAVDFRERLVKCIESMKALLDEGETMDEWKARIAAEDADPKTAAQGMGWFAIEDFAAICDPGPTGFRRRIEGVHGQIVKPRSEATLQQLLGTTWPQYPGRGFSWADWFQFAESWTDALQQARKDAEQVMP